MEKSILCLKGGSYYLSLVSLDLFFKVFMGKLPTCISAAVLVFYCCSYKLPHLSGLKQHRLCQRSDTSTRLRSKCAQGYISSGGSTEESAYLPFPVSQSVLVS